MATEKHDPEDLVIPGCDLNGRSVQISVQVPPLLNRALNEVVKSGKFPFMTEDAAFRWCLYRGLKTLESMDPCIGILPALEIMVLLARTHLHMKVFEEFFAKLDGAILELLTSGFQEPRVRKLVKAIQELILCMPSSRDRELYLSELRRRWGHLLVGGGPGGDGAKPVDIGPAGAVEGKS